MIKTKKMSANPTKADFANKQLEDGNDLQEHSIQNSPSLHLILTSGGGVQIFVETLAGEAIAFKVERTRDVQPTQQKLILTCKQLKAETTFKTIQSKKVQPFIRC
jgi:hypothetical protein